MTTSTGNTTDKNSKPTHTLRKKVGYGKQTVFETIGVAWEREEGGLYIKPYGTQIIDGGFYAFPNKGHTEEDSQ